MSSSSTIDLSTFPKPTVLIQASFEDEMAAMLAQLISIDPTFTALVESDPAYKIMQACAYRILLKVKQFNDRVVAAMLPYAVGTDLENLGATYGTGVVRSGVPASIAIGAGDAGIVLTAVAGGVAGNSIQLAVLAPSAASQPLTVTVTGALITVSLATDVGSAPTSTALAVKTAINATGAALALVTASLPGSGASLLPAAALANLTGGVDESDDSYRNRIHLAPNGFSCAGPKGAYEFFTLSVPGVGDVSVLGANDDGAIPAGTVVVNVMGATGNGLLADPDPTLAGEPGEAPLLAAVRTALNVDDVRPLTDTVIVKGATKVDFAITASIYTYAGPDSATVVAASIAAAQAYVAAQHKIGRTVTLAGINAALYQAGVQNVDLADPVADVAVTQYQFSWCTGITVTFAGVTL